MPDRAFGTQLREARIRAGLTLGDVAGAIGVSVPFLSDVELGRRGPLSPERITIAAQELGIDPTQLLAAAGLVRGFELRDRGDPLGREVAARLAAVWSELSEKQLLELRELLLPSGRE